MLVIKDLHVSIADKPIIRGLDLRIAAGEIHALMGPNGSGKSTLASVLAGASAYRIDKGDVLLDGQSLVALEPEARAAIGLFLAFQYPVEIPGLSCLNFLKTAVNALRQKRQQKALSAVDFLSTLKKEAAALGIDTSFLKRGLNEGFSGGEKKRHEVLQLALMHPKVAIMDETDSGLDIDALQVVARALRQLHSPKRAFLLITHYQRLLRYVEPDVVHVMHQGQIVASGDKKLAEKLEADGYDALVQGQNASTPT